jgi:AcrR family transcriptional regulator
MAAPSEDPSSQRILDAAEVALRRYGAEKTNVVDIARALEMSHGNIYRHFPSKKALLEAVAVRWLDAVTTPMGRIAGDRSLSASERLTRWFDFLRTAKRKKALDDPELFRVHYNIVISAPEVLNDHLSTLLSQLGNILSDGIASGEFRKDLDLAVTARALLHATSPFHHPLFLMQPPLPVEGEAQAVMKLVLAGLKAI